MTVTGNFVSWPEGQCIIDAGSETTISGNTLRNCKTAGIDLNGATGVEASGNRIYDGGAIMTYGIRERNAANDNRLGPNKITNAGAANYLIIGSTTVVDDRSWSVLQGDLPTVIGDGSGIYCSTCTANNSTCAGAGSGAFANRINGGWDCR
jgi:parallel beta-helix repeat protein